MTETRKKIFLEALASFLSATAAAKRAGATRQAFYLLRERDEDFSKLWDDAIEQTYDKLEDECMRRALKKSDLLLIFTLKNVRPWKFRDRVEHIGKDGAPIGQTQVNVLNCEMEKLTDEELDDIKAILSRSRSVTPPSGDGTPTSGNGQGNGEAH